MKHIFLFTIALFALKLSFGQRIDTDRPTQGASALVIPKGSFQVETGFAYGLTTIKNNKRYKETQLTIPTTTLRFSFAKNIELRLAGDINRYKVKFPPIFSNGPEDPAIPNNEASDLSINKLQIGLKFQLLNKEDCQLKLAWLTSFVQTPVNVLSNYELINRLLVSHQIGESFSIGFNLGHTYADNGHNQLFSSLSGTYKIIDELAVFVEPYIFTEENERDNSTDYVTNINAGFIYQPISNLQVDLSLGSNLKTNNEGVFAHSRFISMGISWLLLKK